MSIKDDAQNSIADLSRQKNFLNPVSGKSINRTVTLEVELSSLLVFYHQMGLIRWDKVPLYSTRYQPLNVFADSLIDMKGFLSSEWPLVASDHSETDIWGGMKADIIHISRNKDSIVLFENKVGSGFTSGGTQLERYIKYLKASIFRRKILVIISLKGLLEHGWYQEAFAGEYKEAEVAQLNNQDVEIFFMQWEDIINSTIL